MTPGLFFPIVLLAGLLATRRQVIYWQVVLCLFGAAAAVELTAIGGAVILPSVLFMPFLFAHAWAENYGSRYSRRVPQAVFWLGCAVLYGVVSAIFVPRMMAGMVDIVAVDRSADSASGIAPLRPVSGNLTQSGYAIGGVAAFASMNAILSRPGRMAAFGSAVLVLATLDCVAAIWNLGQYHLGLPDLLTYVRTAYAVFSAYEIPGSGLMRIHGTFSETSAFSGFSLPLMAFCFSLWLHNIRSLYTGTLSVVLLVLLLISTSGTAYVGLALYMFMLGFVLTYRGYVRGTIPRAGLLVAGTLLVTVLLGGTFVLETPVAHRLETSFEVTILDKAESESGMIRATWNHYAWTNFLDTYGLGVGIGTVRASSLSLVLLSNLGALGTLCFLAFLRRVFVGSITSNPEHAPVAEASRQALLAYLACAIVSAATFDLGMVFYFYAAAACAGEFESGIMSRTNLPVQVDVLRGHARDGEVVRA